MRCLRNLFIFFLIVMALPAGIPSNAVYLTNNTGSTVNQPYIIPRWFARGEILHYPKPTGITQWQADVKTRWPDGSVQFSLISFWKSTSNASTDTIPFTDSTNACYLGNQTTCTAAGLDANGMLNFNSGNWSARVTATQGTTVTVDAKTMIGAGYIDKYWVKGPIATVAVIEDRSTARSQDFGWTCTSTYRYTVDATTNILTTLDLATGTTPVSHGFLSGQKVNLGATTTGPSPYTQHFKGNVYALAPSGSTLQISTTAGGAAVDFTTTGTGNLYISGCGGNTDYSNATWTPYGSSDSLRPLHPQFILTFFPGWSGVYEEFVMQNMWVTAMQDQRYTLTLKNGASATNTIISKTIPQFSRGEWVYRAWDGTATTLEFPVNDAVFKPGVSTYAGYTSPDFKINLNTQYMIYSKVLPPLDPSLSVDASASSGTTNNDITLFANKADSENPFRCSSPDGVYCREYHADMTATGGRPELSVVPRWFARYVYSWDPRLFLVTVGNADLVGTIPYHHMESDTTRGNTFDSAHTVSSFGRLLSVNSRPTARIYDVGANMDNTGSGTDPIQYVDSFPAGAITTKGYSFSDAYNWNPDYSWYDGEHQAAFHFWPYLVTGDYFYLEDGWTYTAEYVFGEAATFRHNDWGLLGSPVIRGFAWPWRNMVMLAMMTPDGWPEKDYFTEKANNNIQLFEALMNLRPGQGYYSRTCDPNTFNFSTETSVFCWVLLGKWGYSPGHNILNMPTLQSAGASLSDASIPATTRTVSNIYMSEYFLQVAGWAADLGWQTDKLMTFAPRFLTELTFSPQPREAERYVFPLTYTQPTNVLQSALTTTSLTITLTAPLAFSIDVPFTAAIHASTVSNCNTASNCEWVYICSVNAARTILTVCTTGRGAVRGVTDGQAAKAHSAGDILDLDSQMPLIHSYAAWQAAIDPAYRVKALPFTQFSDAGDGYGHLAVVGLSFGDNTYQGGKNGFDAYTALAAYRDNPLTTSPVYNYTTTSGGYNPQLRYVPRRDPVLNVRVSAGDTFAIIRYKAPSAGKTDSACTVDGVSDGQSTLRDRWYVVTGLTASTTYSSTIHCTADYYNNGVGTGNTTVSYTTIATLSGIGGFNIKLGSGSTTAYVDYGTTSALGSTSSASCTSGCTISPSVNKGLVYYRIRRSGGTQSAIQPVLITAANTSLLAVSTMTSTDVANLTSTQVQTIIP